jgi:Lsr2
MLSTECCLQGAISENGRREHQATVEGDKWWTRIAHVTLVDDLDGSQASETVYFSLGGHPYEIDLSDENAAKLRDGLTPFVAAARRGPGSRRSRRGRAGDIPPPLTDRRETAAIREWARQHGHKIAVRGRIPNAVREAYMNEVG